MARILYGVQGSGHGHAIRALTVARHYPQHDFLFVSYAMGAELLGPEFPVFECQGPDTIVNDHQLALLPVAYENARFFLWEKDRRAAVRRIAHDFKPDIGISDYEYFVPKVCREFGLPCLSLDHQHMITLYFRPLSPGQFLSYLPMYLSIRLLFSNASHFAVISFFQTGNGSDTAVRRLLPPLLRTRVMELEPSDEGHVLAYQGFSTFPAFFDFLKVIKRPVKVYGFQDNFRSGNLHFKGRNEDEFLKDLASCSYVVCGGGHTLMSESLFLGKPIISFPLVNLVEQHLNAFYLDRLGYGRCLPTLSPRAVEVPAFESRLDHYRERISEVNFCGNAEIFSLLDRFIRHGTFDATP